MNSSRYRFVPFKILFAFTSIASPAILAVLDAHAGPAKGVVINNGIQAAVSMDEACPVQLLGFNATPTLQQCRNANLSACPSDIRLQCQGLLWADAANARNPQVQGPAIPACPVAPGARVTLALCQHPDTQVRGACPDEVIRDCRTIVGNAFRDAQRGMPSKKVSAPEDWKQRLSFDHTDAVVEKQIRPGTPDFNVYSTMQRWALASLAAGAPYAGIVENLRTSFERNANRITNCWEYAYENSYNLSRALDEFARQGYEPEKIYDLAFGRGGFAANGQGQLIISSKSGSQKDLNVSLGNKTPYPLTGANVYHRNSYLDAVYIAPVLLMFRNAGRDGIPALPDSRFQSILYHRQYSVEPSFDWHRGMAQAMATVPREQPARLEDGTRKRTGYIDQELDEQYQRQKQFADLLNRFISKALFSPHFYSERLNERFVPNWQWVPGNGSQVNSGVIGTQPLVFGSLAAGNAYKAFVEMYENNDLPAAIAAQSDPFNQFMRSREARDVELRGMLAEIVRTLNAAPAPCIEQAALGSRNYNVCDWSKNLFADRLQEGLIRGDFVNRSYPQDRRRGVFQIAVPGTAEEEYAQCLKNVPRPWNAITLNQRMAGLAGERIPAFCAVGGRAIQENPNRRNGAKPIALPKEDWTPEICASERGIWYQTPQIPQGAQAIDYAASSDNMKRGLQDLEYIYLARAALQQELLLSQLMRVDPSMISDEGRFQLPRVNRGGSGSMGHPDFASIDYSFGFDWSLEGGDTVCSYKPKFDTHGRATVKILGSAVDIVDIGISVNKESASAHAEILGVELFVPKNQDVNTNFSPVNIIVSTKRSDEIAYRQMILIGPVPVTLSMGVAGAVGFSAGIGIQRGPPPGDACDASGARVILSGRAGPTLQLDAFASAGVGGSVLGVGAEAGIRGDLTLIKVEPFAAIDSAIELPDGGNVDSLYLRVKNNYGIPVQYMNGRISAYLKVSYIVDSKTWRKTLVGWDGSHTSQNWTTHINKLELNKLMEALR